MAASATLNRPVRTRSRRRRWVEGVARCGILAPALCVVASRRVNCGLGSPLNGWHVRAVSTLTIPIPDEDLAFLRAYSAAQGISAEALLARQTPSLPDADPRSDRPRCGGRESKFLAARSLSAMREPGT